MIVGLIGLQLSGKTTVFNAVTRGDAEVGSFQSQKGAFNRGRVLVPDERVDWLAELENSKKITFAEVEYIDVAGFSGDKDSVSDTEVPAILRDADALVHVVRAFENETVIHPKGSIDVIRDIQSLDDELVISDLILIENRLGRIEKQAKHTKDDAIKHEFEVLQRIKVHLENNEPLRGVDIDPEDEKTVRGFKLLSLKPMLLVINIGEDDIQNVENLAAQYASLKEKPNVDLVALCGKIEMELAQLPDEDRSSFMEDLGIKESALDLVIKKSYELLGLISYLTVGEKESRAWTVSKGATAPQAAAVIPKDFERGFIRAEVVAFEDLKRTGSHAEAKKQGLVRLEGKNYIMQDGDVVLFRFNV